MNLISHSLEHGWKLRQSKAQVDYDMVYTSQCSQLDPHDDSHLVCCWDRVSSKTLKAATSIMTSSIYLSQFLMPCVQQNSRETSNTSYIVCGTLLAPSKEP